MPPLGYAYSWILPSDEDRTSTSVGCERSPLMPQGNTLTIFYPDLDKNLIQAKDEFGLEALMSGLRIRRHSAPFILSAPMPFLSIMHRVLSSLVQSSLSIHLTRFAGSNLAKQTTKRLPSKVLYVTFASLVFAVLFLQCNMLLAQTHPDYTKVFASPDIKLSETLDEPSRVIAPHGETIGGVSASLFIRTGFTSNDGLTTHIIIGAQTPWIVRAFWNCHTGQPGPIAVQAEHGHVRAERSTRFVCGRENFPVVQYIYESVPDYTGSDQISFFSHGSLIHVDMAEIRTGLRQFNFRTINVVGDNEVLAWSHHICGVADLRANVQNGYLRVLKTTQRGNCGQLNETLFKIFYKAKYHFEGLDSLEIRSSMNPVAIWSVSVTQNSENTGSDRLRDFQPSASSKRSTEADETKQAYMEAEQRRLREEAREREIEAERQRQSSAQNEQEKSTSYTRPSLHGSDQADQEREAAERKQRLAREAERELEIEEQREKERSREDRSLTQKAQGESQRVHADADQRFRDDSSSIRLAMMQAEAEKAKAEAAKAQAEAARAQAEAAKAQTDLQRAEVEKQAANADLARIRAATHDDAERIKRDLRPNDRIALLSPEQTASPIAVEKGGIGPFAPGVWQVSTLLVNGVCDRTKATIKVSDGSQSLCFSNAECMKEDVTYKAGKKSDEYLQEVHQDGGLLYVDVFSLLDRKHVTEYASQLDYQLFHRNYTSTDSVVAAKMREAEREQLWSLGKTHEFVMCD